MSNGEKENGGHMLDEKNVLSLSMIWFPGCGQFFHSVPQ